MTKEEQKTAIAEFCGWPTHHFYRTCVDMLNDLNAMHEAEKVLTGEQQITFIQFLGLDILKMCPLAGDYWMAQELDCWQLLHTTAAQRAEAFLRTIGKWK